VVARALTAGAVWRSSPAGFQDEAEHLPAYLSGDRAEVLQTFPELLYFRDVVFLFKAGPRCTGACRPERAHACARSCS
jgi:hypothetical protein